MKINLIVFLLICTCYSLVAQVVNIEEKRIQDYDKKFQGKIDFSLKVVKNTSDIFQGQNDLKLNLREGRSMFLFINHFGLGQLNRKKFINEGFQHLRYNYDISEHFLTAEVFIQYQYNTIKMLKKRFLAGVGPRFKIIKNDTIHVFFGPMTMYESELLQDEENTTLNTIRLSSYVSMVWNVNKAMSISHITYYQPDYSDFKDFRVNSETNFNLIVSNKFTFKITFDLSYDEEPPEGIPNLFYTFKNGISFSF